jgi:RNA polymerase sigma-70 factor (ECF subfamily)
MTSTVALGTRQASAIVLHEVMSRQELVARAQGGDIAAFESLYRLHEGQIYGLCLRMVADASRAEDLTQEAFARAWEKLPLFRGRSAFSTWLHRLTVNVVIGDLRARERRGHRVRSSEEPEVLRDPAPPRQPEVAIDLQRAIAALPPRARVVFVLHDVEGFRHAEIAELAGIAEGTSKAHLHRARRLLREILR